MTRLVVQQFNWAERDDVTEHAEGIIFWTRGLDARRGVWQSLSTRAARQGHRRRPAEMIRVATSAGHQRHEEGELGLASGSVGGSGCRAHALLQYGNDVAIIARGDDFFAEGRAEALLKVNEFLQNKFRINLVSLASPRHEKDILFLKRPITCRTESARQETCDELNFGCAKDATTPGSKATAANDPHSEDNPTSQKGDVNSTPHRPRFTHVWTGCFVRHSAKR